MIFSTRSPHVNPRRRLGYTLTELLVVMAILALLTALLAPRLLNRLSDARAQTCAAQIRNLASAVGLFEYDVGRVPTEQEGLQALVEAPAGSAGWAGPYLDRDAIPVDPWGKPYLFELEASTGRFRISSLGADGVKGGDGPNKDLSNR